MKNINTKKVIAGAAALAVGASFLGAAVAAQVDFGSPVVKGDVIGTNGMPTATIIVGNESQAADSIWAGNIAAAIASKAYTTETHTTEDVVIPPTPGTTATVNDGEGLLEDNVAITQIQTALNLDLAESDYAVLHDEDVTGKITGDNSYEIKETETLTIGGYTLFSDDKDVEDFMTLIAQNGITYRATFEGNGIPHDEDVGDYFTTGDDLDIWFMGNKYSIQSISSAGDKIVLVGSGSKVAYETGAEIEVTGTDDTAYKVVVGNAFNDGSKIQLALKSASGTTLNSQTFEVDDDVEFPGYPLNESISVVEILDESGGVTNVDIVTLSVGAGNSLTLEDGEALPGYEEGNDNLWEVTVTGDANYITDIYVKNKAKVWDTVDKEDDDAGLLIGDKINLPLNLGVIDFQGLTSETEYDLEIGDGLVKWADNDGRSHEAFFYEDNVKNDTVSVDGEDYYFAYTTAASGTVTIKNNDSSGSTVGTITGVDGAWVSTEGYLEGSNDLPIEYKLNYSNSKLMMSLDANSYNYGKNTSATWDFVGTTNDLNLSTVTDISPGLTNFYASTTEDAEATAIFKVTDGGSKPVYIFVDPYTEDLPIKDDYSTSSENYYAQAWYDFDADADTTDADPSMWSLDQDDSDNDMSLAYTNYGAKFEVDGSVAKVTMPQDTLYMKFFVGGAETTTTTTGGSDGSVIPGTTYTVTTPANIDAINLVKSDLASVAGTKIIVGGHLANKLAVGVTNDYLTQAGQWVMGKDTTTGNIVVAGFTADDTGAATRAFITAIQ